MRHACRGPVRRALYYRAAIDIDDVVQRSLQTACRLLPLYTSRERPPCSWLGMLRLDARRDLYREVSRLDWLPEDVAAAVTIARACGVDRHDDPSATLAALMAAAGGLGVPMPRVAALQLDAALVARTVMTWEPGLVRTVPGPECREREARRVRATMAGLVTDDAEIIARAGAGDPRALARVGDQVALRLAGRDDCIPATRRRCWEQFQRSGRLFTSSEGIERFGPGQEFASLAAMDACLRRAAGIARSSD